MQTTKTIAFLAFLLLSPAAFAERLTVDFFYGSQVTHFLVESGKKASLSLQSSRADAKRLLSPKDAEYLIKKGKSFSDSKRSCGRVRMILNSQKTICIDKKSSSAKAAIRYANLLVALSQVKN